MFLGSRTPTPCEGNGVYSVFSDDDEALLAGTRMWTKLAGSMSQLETQAHRLYRRNVEKDTIPMLQRAQPGTKKTDLNKKTYLRHVQRGILMAAEKAAGADSSVGVAVSTPVFSNTILTDSTGTIAPQLPTSLKREYSIEISIPMLYER